MLSLTLALCGMLQGTTPVPPRVTCEQGTTRYVYQYDGRWAEVTPTGRTKLREKERTATTITLTDATGRQVTLPGAGKWTEKFPTLDLGSLSEKYESGGRGPGTVSSGVGDPGGVSYGSYQLASKVGRADAFVKKYYPTEFAGLSAGTPAFTEKWKQLALADPAGLHAKEHEYIHESHFAPQLAKLKKDLGWDAAAANRVLQDSIWSTAVHHGPNTDVIVKAVQATPTATSDEAALLKAIYAERGRTNSDGTLAWFPRVSDDWIPALTKRFRGELADALAAFK
ncbi:MAG: hypothetical protein ACRCZF_02895 [Gemmataceae bacterium]